MSRTRGECVAGSNPCAEPQLFLYFPHQPESEQASAWKDPPGQASYESDVAVE